MVNDPIGDMLIQIKNASMSGRKTVTLPYSKMKHAVLKLLVEEGYILHVDVKGEDPKRSLFIELQYDGRTSVISHVKRLSKPSFRKYVPKDRIPNVVGGLGMAILSTSKGIMTGKHAKKQGIGGEVLCEIW